MKALFAGAVIAVMVGCLFMLGLVILTLSDLALAALGTYRARQARKEDDKHDDS